MEQGTRIASSVVAPLEQQTESYRQGLRQRRALHERRVVQTYQSPARLDFNPTHTTLYLNIGYWAEGAQSLDEAAQAMARLVAEVGQFNSSDEILDAGCGYGDSDFFWATSIRPRSIVGIDINAEEVSKGVERAKDLNLATRIELRVASAVEMPFEDASFDKVASIEASHHFLTREDFLREAYRVMRPGGRLVTTDVLPLPGRSARFLNPVNSYSADVYITKLRDAGFTNITARSIRADVYKSYSNYLLRRLRLSNVKGLVNILAHRFMLSRLDYVLFTADKV